MLSRRQVMPRQHSPDVAQVDERNVPVLGALRHVRQGVGDPARKDRSVRAVYRELRA